MTLFPHAFLVNCHKDIAQAVRLTTFLVKHFRADSAVAVYRDGPEEPEGLFAHCDGVFWAGHEPNKPTGLVKAVNWLTRFDAKTVCQLVWRHFGYTCDIDRTGTHLLISGHILIEIAQAGK